MKYSQFKSYEKRKVKMKDTGLFCAEKFHLKPVRSEKEKKVSLVLLVAMNHIFEFQ